MSHIGPKEEGLNMSHNVNMIQITVMTWLTKETIMSYKLSPCPRFNYQVKNSDSRMSLGRKSHP